LNGRGKEAGSGGGNSLDVGGQGRHTERFRLRTGARGVDGVPIPVIASGGMGGFSDFAEVVESGHADAVAMATVFHYGEISVMDLRRDAITRGIKVRNVEV